MHERSYVILLVQRLRQSPTRDERFHHVLIASNVLIFLQRFYTYEPNGTSIGLSVLAGLAVVSVRQVGDAHLQETVE